MHLLSYLSLDKNGVIIKIKVIPGSSQNLIGEVIEDRLKVKITAPPVEGQANEAVIVFFSKVLHIAKSHIEIYRGELSKKKDLLVRGLLIEEIEKKLTSET